MTVALNSQFDVYIEKAQPFAQPILTHLRKVIHKGCKDVEEVIKWGFPNFVFKGKILCSMAAFKQHATFGFWLASQMKTMVPYLAKNTDGENTSNGMGHFGKITQLKEIPSEKLLLLMIKEAMQLINDGTTLKKAMPVKTAAPVCPTYLKNALQKNKKAGEIFDKASASFRKEYIMWLTDAKTEATRDRRLATALEWIAEGKGRNWKYEKC